MKSYRMWKVLKILIIVIVAVGLFGLVTEHLWNWLFPTIFGLGRITFPQAFGLLVISKILFGGFHRHVGGHRGWKRHMAERWENMTPEEREKFRSGMRGRGRCGFGPPREVISEQKPI